MFTDMEKWSEIRRRVLVDGLGKRAACRTYGIHYKTLTKILTHAEPPGYRRTAPRRPSAWARATAQAVASMPERRARSSTAAARV